ncbi:hypothetical protein GCM10027592_63120 [Spirosoma flavus]
MLIWVEVQKRRAIWAFEWRQKIIEQLIGFQTVIPHVQGCLIGGDFVHHVSGFIVNTNRIDRFEILDDFNFNIVPRIDAFQLRQEAGK